MFDKKIVKTPFGRKDQDQPVLEPQDLQAPDVTDILEDLETAQQQEQMQMPAQERRRCPACGGNH